MTDNDATTTTAAKLEAAAERIAAVLLDTFGNATTFEVRDDARAVMSRASLVWERSANNNEGEA